MRAEAGGLRHVSGERIGGGLAADGMGELSKLLLGARPRDALRIARDTGALVEVVPEFGAAIGYDLGTARQPVPLDEHIFAVVQNAADAGASLAVRLAALFHDLGKPEADADDGDHAQLGARIAGRIMRRLRYPNTLRQDVVRARRRARVLARRPDRRRLRAALPRLARPRRVPASCSLHKRVDLAAKEVEPWELEHLALLERRVEEQRDAPHRLGDLAVDGRDLIELGLPGGPGARRASSPASSTS